MYDRVRSGVRADNGKPQSLSQAVIDSQSIKSATEVLESAGYDSGNQVKGQKHYLTVDALGLLLGILVATSQCMGENQSQADAAADQSDGK